MDASLLTTSELEFGGESHDLEKIKKFDLGVGASLGVQIPAGRESYFSGMPMEWLKGELEIRTPGQGLHEFTERVQSWLRENGVQEGLCHLFLQHTSASLLISENYDPSARRDLEEFLRRLAPEGQAWHEHDAEGEDDSPAHMRALVTGISESIPVEGGRLALGTWQGLYLCEHRKRPHRRKVLLRCLKVS